MGARDGVDSATWADPPSSVRKKKIARAQFGEEGARDPAGHGLARRVHVIPRLAGGRGSSFFAPMGEDQVDHLGGRRAVPFFVRAGGTRWTTWASGGLFPLSLEGGPGGFLFRVAAG